MNLFYQPDITPQTTKVTFDKDESRHIHKVLRKKEGDKLMITNGKGNFFYATLKDANPKKSIAHITETSLEAPLPYNLHIAVAPTKLNDRYEWFLEKATEIGVTEITPIICDHSERKIIKRERYNKIVVGAMKQSLKAYLPKLNEAVTFKEFIANTSNYNHKLIAHCVATEKKSLKDIIHKNQSVLLLIGPEGDFSLPEIELANKNNFAAISLGNTRLRTETAAVVGVHSVAFINQ